LPGKWATKSLRARYLVGADGGRSFVRHVLGVDFPGETLGVRAIVADVELEGIGRDAWHRFGSEQEQVLICPLAGTSLFQVQGPVPLEGDVDLTPAGLTALVAERTGRDIVIHSVSWASAYAMNARLADRYRVGRRDREPHRLCCVGNQFENLTRDRGAVEVTLPRVLGSRGVHRGGVVDEQVGVQPSRHAASGSVGWSARQ
jgi:2-polyprenyl-6-methoxyphenol hydroxylase-like FAD-dependent oxidoreductase